MSKTRTTSAASCSFLTTAALPGRLICDSKRKTFSYEQSLPYIPSILQPLQRLVRSIIGRALLCGTKGLGFESHMEIFFFFFFIIESIKLSHFFLLNQ